MATWVFLFFTDSRTLLNNQQNTTILKFVMNAGSLEWTQLPVVGPTSPPRCGHTATMVEKRLLILGGRGGLFDFFIY